MAGNFLAFKAPLLGGAHHVDRVGVQEQFKVQLDTRDQTFTRLEGWQMRADDEGVPMFVQQPAGQRSPFCISFPISIGGDIGIGASRSHFINHIELIDPALRGQLGGSFFSVEIQ